MKKHYLFALIFSLLFSFSFSQTTRYVATAANGGVNTGNATTEAAPWETLTYAIENADEGDTILIGPGTFTESQLVVSKALTIQGHGRAETIFDGTGLGNAYFMSIRDNVT